MNDIKKNNILFLSSFFDDFFQKKNQSVPDNYFINVSLAALIKICPFLYQNNNNTFTMNATKMETTLFCTFKVDCAYKI